MKVICKDHKLCSILECVHKVPHIHNSYEWSMCVNVKFSSCFCSEDKQYNRKEKLKKIFNEN